MSYRVLARTYRSTTFEEVVGQGPISTTLRNAILSNRVHHGYLFTGTRGVGKTSMARILAKALNCLSVDEPTVTPCCECESCQAVAAGEDIDVVEIDAASNTGVDNIRELRSNATLRPARSRFKVYIIDEVHMLSTGAFNALLKTLEEPPSHVKFILATTDSQKVPATIQSRCQRFDFQAIDSASIAKHLSEVLDREGVESDEAVVKRIARLANGSMRDALSLLDMVLSFESKHLTASIVDELIPPPHDEMASAVLDAVAAQDSSAALEAFDRALQSGRTVERFCTHLIEQVRTLMLMCVCGEETELVDVASPMRPELFKQAKRFDAPTYVYMIALLEELRRNVKFSGAARALADAAIVRLSLSHQFTDIGELIERLESSDSHQGVGAIQSRSKKKADAEPPRIESQPAQVPATTDRQDAKPKPSKQGGNLAPRPAAVSSEQWEKAVRDPFVQRVKEAVDGTLTDIRPAPSRELTGDREETAETDQGTFNGLE